MKPWIALFAAGLMLHPVLARAQTAAAQAPQPCALPLLASLDMTTDPDGRVAVPAKVNGRGVRLLADTGGTVVTLESTIADELQLTRFRSAPQTLAGNIVMSQSVQVKSLDLGSLHGANFNMLIMPSYSLTLNDNGVIGGSLMGRYNVEFDFARAKFNLFEQGHCPGAVVYWTKSAYADVPMKMDEQNHITVPVTLNGKQMTAIVDTGAAHSVMSLETAKALLGIDVKDAAMKSIGGASINGASMTQIYRYPFSTLALQGVTVNNPEIDLVPQSAFFRYGGGPQLLLGIGVLRQLHIYIAYDEQVLYVTPAEAQ